MSRLGQASPETVRAGLKSRQKELPRRTALSRRLTRRARHARGRQKQRRGEPARAGERQPQPRSGWIPGRVNQIRADSRSEAPEGGGRDALCEGKPGGPDVGRHDFCQKDAHGAKISPEEKREPQVDLEEV